MSLETRQGAHSSPYMSNNFVCFKNSLRDIEWRLTILSNVRSFDTKPGADWQPAFIWGLFTFRIVTWHKNDMGSNPFKMDLKIFSF